MPNHHDYADDIKYDRYLLTMEDTQEMPLLIETTIAQVANNGRRNGYVEGLVICTSSSGT